MQIRHDPQADAIRIKLNEKKVAYRVEVQGEVITIGMDEAGNIVDVSILGASHHVPHPNQFEYVDITRQYEPITS